MAALPISSILSSLARPVRANAPALLLTSNQSCKLEGRSISRIQEWNEAEARLRRRASYPLPAIILVEKLRLLNSDAFGDEVLDCASGIESFIDHPNEPTCGTPCPVNDLTSQSTASMLGKPPASSSTDQSRSTGIIISRNERLSTDFQNLVLIGRGGFGSVVRAQNCIDGCEYAIKIVPLSKTSAIEREQALSEPRIMARLPPHPNVVRYYSSWFGSESAWQGMKELPFGKDVQPSAGSSFSYSSWALSHSPHSTEISECSLLSSQGTNDNSEHDTLHIQMSLCGDGSTLAQYLQSRSERRAESGDSSFVRGSLGPEELAVFRQVVSAVSHIHANGVMHLDLSSRNIFRHQYPTDGGESQWCVGDFSFAQPTSRSSHPAGTRFGTYLYAAPELLSAPVQLEDEAQNKSAAAAEISSKTITVSSAVDVFSLGVILTELCLDFGTAMERALVLETLRKKGSAPDSITDCDVAGLVSSMVARDPSSRPKMGDVTRQLLRI